MARVDQEGNLNRFLHGKEISAEIAYGTANLENECQSFLKLLDRKECDIGRCRLET